VAPFKLILFDLDDTLCDYVGARAQRLRIAFGSAFEEDGTAPVDLDAVIAESIKVHPHGADHFAELLSRFGLQDEEAAARARHWYQTNRFHGLKLFPDALELLHLAKSACPGCKIGLITNGPAEVQRAKIELLELEAHVDFALISGEFGCAKPDPAIFREAMRLGGAAPEETLVIGDSPEFDIAGAKGLGISAVWVNRTGATWSFSGPCPDYEVDSLTAVGSLLAELLK
jgi:FMN hydrolase / 5-amino-6-(5-phospho-D-ribitylamino)uracil phosphatase